MSAISKRRSIASATDATPSRSAERSASEPETDLRFGTIEDVERKLDEALDGTVETYATYGITEDKLKRWIEINPKGSSATKLNSEIARQIQPYVDRHLKREGEFNTQGRAQITGNLVHRISELRTMRHYPDDLAIGKRLVEHRIGEMGKNSKELDLVITRGDKHFIYDHKPVNLAEIDSESWGQDFKRWLQKNYDGDWTQIGNYRSMNPQLRKQFRGFVSETLKQHRGQLQDYRDRYAKVKGIAPEKVKSVVLPYFTWL